MSPATAGSAKLATSVRWAIRGTAGTPRPAQADAPMLATTNATTTAPTAQADQPHRAIAHSSPAPVATLKHHHQPRRGVADGGRRASPVRRVRPTIFTPRAAPDPVVFSQGNPATSTQVAASPAPDESARRTANLALTTVGSGSPVPEEAPAARRADTQPVAASRWTRGDDGDDTAARRYLTLPTGEAGAELFQRLLDSFLGRCVRRFVRMAGIDRCIVLSSQAFTALIPILILVSTLAPAGYDDVIARTIINKFALTGDSADAVNQLFAIQAGAAGSASLFSALLVIWSGISFTRRLQTMYRMAWEQDKEGVRSGLFAAFGLLVLLAEMVALYIVRSLFRQFPPSWFWVVLVSVATGVVLWTSIPYLLLNRQLHWRRLLVAGTLAAVGSTLFSMATTVYMSELVTEYTDYYGLFGVTIAMVGWLLAAAGVIVASTAIGAEFDASDALWVRRLKVRFRLHDPAQDISVDTSDTPSDGLNADDLVMLLRALVNWLALTAAVWAATALVPGIDVPGGFITYLGVSILFGFVNALLGPLLHLVALPLSVFTLGSVALVVNTILLAVTAGLSENLSVGGLGSVILGTLVISVVTTVLELVLHPFARRPVGSSDPGEAPRQRHS